jgi:hypothetical protein
MELSSSSVQGVRDDFNKEMRDFESTVISTEASKTENANNANPDPLAHLPEHFRKEIEAQCTVSSRKVSFKVCYISIQMTLTTGTISFRLSSGKIVDALGNRNGHRIWCSISPHDNYIRIGKTPPLY